MGLDAGADTIGWHLTHHHSTTLSRATINRILARAGAVTPEPKKRPKNSYIRFEAAQPNETWQSDFTHYRLADGTRHVTHRGGIRRIEQGTDVEILTWLDDCSRYALSFTAHRPVTCPTPATIYTSSPKATPSGDPAPTPTTASATTRSTKPAASPCASPANSGTSASAEPTPEPTSSCSSKTSTSPS